ncbi:MAG: hypothetical protein HOP28_10365, partial [Gemmatimonadales bacterium]|nr:hypothetical protein [Gemmatimonadales bacterium]
EWERAVAAASAAVAEEAERRLRHAAIAARYPAKRLASLLPDVEEKRVLSARLSAVGVPLEEGTADLGEAPSEWIGAITRMAGELESAWDGLHRAARQELQMWERRADGIRGWRRPWRTLGLIGGLSLSLAVWAGLVLGGFLPVPNFLRPAAEWLWSLPWP